MKIGFQQHLISNKRKIFAAVFLLCLLIIFGFILFYIFKIFQITDQNSQQENNFLNHHIIIAGGRNNADYLRQVYEGAAAVAGDYSAVVELLLPSSQAEDDSLLSKLEYASALGASGIIAYIDSDSQIVQAPKDVFNGEIPLVCLGQQNPYNDSICYIGPNKFELGQILAKTAVLLCPDGGNLLIPVDAVQNREASGQLIGNMNQALNEYYARQASDEETSANSVKRINVQILELKNDPTISPDDFIRQEIIARHDINCVLCLSHADTLRVAQTVIDLNRTSIAVIGFEESEKTLDFLQRGVLQALVSFNARKTGELAMAQIFEYIKNGNANVYIPNDIRVLRGKNLAEIDFKAVEK